jgi:hypothetical protein
MTTKPRRRSPVFDAAAWTGRWPFSFAPAFDARTLRAHLARHGIARALVSPLEAVFQPEPGPANRDLLASTRGVRGLVPVPVVNPALGNWREELALCAADPRVRAVRVLPNYHAFRVDGAAMRALAEALDRRDLRLIVQVRLIDERHEFHAMNLRPVSTAGLAAFLRSDRRRTVLAAGLTRAEVLGLLPRHPGLRADLSMAEWHDTLEHLATKADPGRLLAASHTPFLVTAAGVAKVARSTLPVAIRRAVAGGNLVRFLAPSPRTRIS